jgi:sigma-B regulation protein RsbU (phosphoserine phosphatase)
VMAIAHQAAVAIEGARLTHEAEDKRRLDYELGLARQIQTSFLPEACPVIPGYQVCSMWQTAREVSGDFYDFVSLHGGRVAMTIADVSDKGMAAAMFMALSRTILRTMTIGKPTPREAVERANDVILADARSEMFVTVFHGILDPQQHRFTYVNAGHNPPLFYRAAHKKLTTLKGHGIALGVMPNITLEEQVIDFEPDDILLMYTDGVTDAIDAQEEEFGTERLADLIMSNVHLAPDALIEEIKRAVTDFAGEGVHFDDLTIIALKRVEDKSVNLFYKTKTQGEEVP